MRSTAQLSSAIAERFLIGAGHACVHLLSKAADVRLTVDSASALGADGWRIWLGNEKVARKVLARVLSSYRQSRRVGDDLLIALPMADAIAAVESVVALEGLGKTSDAEFARIAQTIAGRIEAFAKAGGLKPYNREYQALASPAKTAQRQANQAAHTRAQEVFGALPDSERSKLKAEFKAAQAAGKTSWSAFLASAFPDLPASASTATAKAPNSAELPAYETWLIDRIGPQIAAMASGIGKLRAISHDIVRVTHKS